MRAWTYWATPAWSRSWRWGRVITASRSSGSTTSRSAKAARAPVVTSAGALVEGLKVLKAKRIAMIAPYMKSLCTMVADYIEHEGFQVMDRVDLEIPDNLEVGRRDPLALVEIYKQLKLEGVDALVLSSCVQMPSLAAVPVVEKEVGIPVVSASICTAYQMLKELGLKRVAPNAGALLSGDY